MALSRKKATTIALELSEAEAALDRAAERKLAIPDYLVDRYNLAFLTGNRVGMEKQVVLSRGKSEVEDSISNLEGFVSAYFGRLAAALNLPHVGKVGSQRRTILKLSV
jgi:hypothetical protein